MLESIRDYIWKTIVEPILDGTIQPAIRWFLRRSWPIRVVIVGIGVTGVYLMPDQQTIYERLVALHVGSRVLFKDRPLSQDSTRNLDAFILDLETANNATLKKTLRSANHVDSSNAWAIAQMIVARNWIPGDGGTTTKPRLDKLLAEALQRLKRDRLSDCTWTEYTNDPVAHTVVTAWVLHAHALYGQQNTCTVKALLGAQKDNGGWAVYFDSTEKNDASSYATARVVIALSAANMIVTDAGEKEDINIALDHAKNWLRTRRRSNGWSDYPAVDDMAPNPTMTAHVLHALSLVAADGGQRDTALWTEWAESLPRNVPSTIEYTANVRPITLRRFISRRDTVRAYSLPSMILVTATAFKFGNWKTRIACAQWLETMITDSQSQASLASNYPWLAAELLIALKRLRYLQDAGR